MPWGANRLRIDSALLAVKDGLVLASDTPSGLRWALDYHGSKRVRPGEPAGSYEARLKQWVVTVRGWPLYARHAVWMLANDQPIPEDMDISASNGDLSNLSDPTNLIAVPQDVPATRAPRTEGQSARGRMPDSVTFEALPHAFSATIHIGKKAFPLIITHNPRVALRAAALAAVAFGYLPDTMGGGLKEDTEATLWKILPLIYAPVDKANWTLGQKNVAAKFVEALQLQAAEIRRREEASAEK